MKTPPIQRPTIASLRQWFALGGSALLTVSTVLMTTSASDSSSNAGDTPAAIDTTNHRPNAEAPVFANDISSMSLPKQTTVNTSPNDTPINVPHPITPEHERLFAVNRLVHQARQAVDSRDVPQLRMVLAQLGELEPTDPFRHRQGYERIADCLENPGAASRAAAQNFVQTETASPVRRLVRRRCLEGR